MAASSARAIVRIAAARNAIASTTGRRACLHTSAASAAKLSPEYPEHTVQKNNWIEKNEIVRENKFSQWEFTWSNTAFLFVAVGMLPAVLYKFYHDEMRLRDSKCRNRETHKHML